MTKVLVADDEAGIRKLLGHIFSDVGYDVIEAVDGSSALERACIEQPDVILLDVMMPVMDGFEVLREIRQNSATEYIPVILITAMEAGKGEQQGMELGIDHYLTKPLEPAVVKTAVKLALRTFQKANAPVKVGSSQLDGKLGGGIPPGSLTLIEGTSSAGKSVLCQHLIHGALEVGHPVACFTSEDSLQSLVSQMGSIGLPIASHVSAGNLRVLPVREPGPAEQGGALLTAFAEEMEQVLKESKLAIVDSITSLASVSEEYAVAAFFSHCKRLCSNRKTIILVVHSFALDERMLIRLRSLCDADLKLSVEVMGEKQVRVLEVSKIHSANQNTGNVVTFEVEPGMGIHILPFTRAKA